MCRSSWWGEDWTQSHSPDLPVCLQENTIRNFHSNCFGLLWRPSLSQRRIKATEKLVLPYLSKHHCASLDWELCCVAVTLHRCQSPNTHLHASAVEWNLSIRDTLPPLRMGRDLDDHVKANVLLFCWKMEVSSTTST